MKKQPIITRNEHTIDATGQSMGRLASQIAVLLRGKNKASFEPHIDGGDVVRIQNVDKMKMTGNKEENKVYYRHTRYPGGIKTESLRDLNQNKPGQLLKMCVRKMLPDNTLRKEMLKRLIIE